MWTLPGIKTMAAAQFKAHCLRVMDEVQRSREPVLITKKGRPVARLVPADAPPKSPFGALAGVLEIVGDVVSPVVQPADWAAWQ